MHLFIEASRSSSACPESEEHEHFLFLPKIEIRSSSSNPNCYMEEATMTDVKAFYHEKTVIWY
jgi:hypothetical protein